MYGVQEKEVLGFHADQAAKNFDNIRPWYKTSALRTNVLA